MGWTAFPYRAAQTQQMARAPDRGKVLHKSAVARIAGTTPGHYGDLLAEEVLGARPPRLLPAVSDGGCSLLDCIRLVVLKSLIDALNRDARAAYCRIRDRIPEMLFVDDVDVVYDKQSGSCLVCATPGELAEAVRVRRPVVVVALGTTLLDARERFAEQATPRRAAAKRHSSRLSSGPIGQPS